MCRAKPLSSIPTIIGPPPRKMTRTNLELLGDLRGALACHQPPYRRELHLPVENPPFSCGHPAFLGTVFLVFVSHFWGALQKHEIVFEGIGPHGQIVAVRLEIEQDAGALVDAAGATFARPRK